LAKETQIQNSGGMPNHDSITPSLNQTIGIGICICHNYSRPST